MPQEKISAEEARKRLADVDSSLIFWLAGGGTLKSLSELSAVLPGMSNEVFSQHVNAEKNDFASWIRDVIHDEKLASKVRKSTSKSAIAKAVASRLSELKKSSQ